MKRSRPQSEWLIAEAPSLRIISDELFEAVQKRFRDVNEKYARKTGRPGLANGLRGNEYIFSGFLKCASCGANLVLVSGRGRRGYDRYGCPQNSYRGTCVNKVRVRRDQLETQLIEGLQNEVLKTDAIEEIVKCMAEALQNERSALSMEAEQLQRRKDILKSERKNLIDTIAGGFNNDSVRTAIVEREKEINDINVNLDMVKARAPVPDLDALRTFAVSKLADLRLLLVKSDNVPEFRHMLANKAGTLQMEPTEDNGIACYLAKGRLDFLTGEEQTRWVGAAGRS